MGGLLGFLSGTGGSSAISGVSSLLGGALGYAYNKKLMQAQQAYNTSERLATQQYNTSEREAAQQYNTGEREAQNAYAEQMYNTYSSPAALVRQYEDAGLNPRLAIGSNTAGSVAASSGHSASVSPQSSGMLGITPPYQDVNSFTAGFVNIANALKSLAEAKNKNVDTTWLENSMKDRLKGLVLSNEATDLANKLNFVKLYYAPERERAEIDNILKDIAEGTASIEEIKARTAKWVEEGLMAKYEREHWLELYTERLNNLKADTANKESDTVKNETEADLNRANKVVASYRVFEIQQNIKESEAREEFFRNNAGYAKVNSEFIKIQKDILEGSKNQKIAYDKEYWKKQKENLSTLQEQLKVQLDLAKKDKDWYAVRALTDILNKTAQTVQTVQAIQYKPAEFLSSFVGN